MIGKRKGELMKKIIGILFGFQLCVIVFYGVFLFRFESAHRILDGGISVDVDFGNDIDHFHRFIDALYETEQFVTLQVGLSMGGTTLHFYTTDVTLGGEVMLSSGRFPEPETAEFIHSHETGQENQVGVIDDILPGYVISVTHFSNPFNFTMDGFYFFQTEDLQMVQTFVETVTPYVTGISVFYDEWLFENSIWVNLMFALGVSGTWELAGLSITFFLSMFLLLLQYGIHIVRKHTIFKLHGISMPKVLKNVTLSTLAPLLIGGAGAYFLSVVYVYLMRFHLFLADISLSFMMIAGIFILFYLCCINLFVYGYLRFSNQMATVKGRKSYPFIQLLNHLLKGAFSLLLLVSFSMVLDNIHDLNVRLAARPFWEDTQDVYRINFSTAGYWAIETEMAITESVRKMYDYLTTYHGGFLMDGQQIDAILERGIIPYFDAEEAPPLELSPHGYRITISPSFLEVNPIQAVNGIEIGEQLIWDAYVKNLLVPQSLQPDEAILYELYLDQFYFEKVSIYNSYAELLGKPLSETTLDELSLNLIYVYDHQCYFTFSGFLKMSTGGLLCNPVAHVFHPDNAHGNSLFVMFQNSFYFRSDEPTQGAFEAILPAIQRYDLESNIRFITPVYPEFVSIMQLLTRQLMRLTVLTVLLVISTLAVTYYLMATYFENNKYKLTVKRHFGYHTLKRNKGFVLLFLGYTVPIMMIGGWLLGWIVFLIALAVVMVDLLAALAFEQQLMKKSFAEIMKGER